MRTFIIRHLALGLLVNTTLKDNADGLIATLREKGYDAQPAGQNPDGLHMVCYFSSEDKSEALINLAMIRKDSNPYAWLLKK